MHFIYFGVWTFTHLCSFIHILLLLQMKNVEGEASYRLINLTKEMFLIKLKRKGKYVRNELSGEKVLYSQLDARPSRLFFLDISSSLDCLVHEN